MAYNEKYRERAISYKDNGHTFKELQETFKGRVEKVGVKIDLRVYV